MLTNGSIINKDVLALLHEAESVEMCISEATSGVTLIA